MTPEAALLQRLAAMVVKRGLGLGVLSAEDRDLALAVPAHCLSAEPGPAPLNERAVTRLLEACLAAEGAFLRTDAVELRRWLCDSGWWQRDGYGSAYARTPMASLPEALQPIAQACAAVDLLDWVHAQQQRSAAERDARRTAHDQGQHKGLHKTDHDGTAP